MISRADSKIKTGYFREICHDNLGYNAAAISASQVLVNRNKCLYDRQKQVRSSIPDSRCLVVCFFFSLTTTLAQRLFGRRCFRTNKNDCELYRAVNDIKVQMNDTHCWRFGR